MGPGSRRLPEVFLGHEGSMPSTSLHATVPQPCRTPPCDRLSQQSIPTLSLPPLVWEAESITQPCLCCPCRNPASPSISLHPLPHLLLSANTLRPVCLNPCTRWGSPSIALFLTSALPSALGCVFSTHLCPETSRRDSEGSVTCSGCAKEMFHPRRSCRRICPLSWWLRQPQPLGTLTSPLGVCCPRPLLSLSPISCLLTVLQTSLDKFT